MSSLPVRGKYSEADQNIPSGRWRDGTFSCFAFGPFHPACLMGFFCAAPLLGQVQTRLGLSFLGTPQGSFQTASTPFRIWMAIVVITVLICIIILSIEAIRVLYNLFSNLLFILIVGVTMITRIYVRAKYSIPAEQCQYVSGLPQLEDCCCALWCTGCTICQMARHTADYGRHPAGCCTDNGMHNDL